MEYDFLKWLGHAGFMFETEGLRVFVDPLRIGSLHEHADVVFITHSHQDHLSIDDLKKVADEETLFVAPDEALRTLPYKKTVPAKPGRGGDARGIRFESVHAYNTEPERLGFHPKDAGMVGYVIEVEGKRIYHAGDTDLTEEMKRVNADLALLPSGGKYTMDLGQAIRATQLVKATNFSPIHYKALLGVEGSSQLEKRFGEEVKNSIILKEINEPFYSF